jgi:hypothetical protein
LGDSPVGVPKIDPLTGKVDRDEDLRFHWLVRRSFNGYGESSLRPTGQFARFFYPSAWDMVEALFGRPCNIYVPGPEDAPRV